ncbi:MAG: hypothetical protein EBX37_11750 [Alphaproteobacteria bacterium]|nr:hypothetical protein [Alphaproteobacteria bacterium]
MTISIILALSAFLMTLLGTRITILALRQREAMLGVAQLPGSAKKPAPSGGGAVVVMVLIICLLVADINYGVVLSLFLLAAVSLLDGLIAVPLLIRLLVQLLAVLLSLELVPPLFAGVLPGWADRTLVAVLWLWCINLFEFMDGIDGITPTEMVCIGIGLTLVAVFSDTFPSMLSTYGLIVFAAGWGFMWWNWYPSKIRLGEVGTVPIGFLMGYLLLLAAQQGYGYAALILPAYHISDATLTLLYRAAKGKRIWAKHSEYYYRTAVGKGRRPDTVVRYVFGLNILLILLATFTVINPELAIFYVGLAYMAVFMILGFFAYSPHNPRHEPF